MRYRVEELAAAAGVRVDTIRFYQARGLVPPPEREGRVAHYGPEHLRRLREIQKLSREGFKLEQIAKLIRSGAAGMRARAPKRGRRKQARDAGVAAPLLTALVEQGVGARSYTRAELAALSGASEPILAAAQAGGLLQPVVVAGEERFSEADLGMCRAALVIFGAGFPIQELLALAAEHARATSATADRAIAIFEQRARSGATPGPELAALFRQLLPEATRLVALHFQRTVVRRALERMRDTSAGRELEEALAAARESRLEVAWR